MAGMNEIRQNRESAWYKKGTVGILVVSGSHPTWVVEVEPTEQFAPLSGCRVRVTSTLGLRPEGGHGSHSSSF